jgi:hypothetical protein
VISDMEASWTPFNTWNSSYRLPSGWILLDTVRILGTLTGLSSSYVPRPRYGNDFYADCTADYY